MGVGSGETVLQKAKRYSHVVFVLVFPLYTNPEENWQRYSRVDDQA